MAGVSRLQVISVVVFMGAFCFWIFNRPRVSVQYRYVGPKGSAVNFEGPVWSWCPPGGISDNERSWWLSSVPEASGELRSTDFPDSPAAVAADRRPAAPALYPPDLQGGTTAFYLGLDVKNAVFPRELFEWFPSPVLSSAGRKMAMPPGRSKHSLP